MVCSRSAHQCVTQVAGLRAWSPPRAGPRPPSERPDPEGALCWQPRTLRTFLGCPPGAGGPQGLDLCWEPRVQVPVSPGTRGAGICMCQRCQPCKAGCGEAGVQLRGQNSLLCQGGPGICTG